MSTKSPFSLSRQGTLRSSHRRKNSLSAGSAVGMSAGRRSPVMLSPRSPAAGEMPGGFGNGGGSANGAGGRSPTTLFAERRSNQSFSSQGRRSPVAGGFYEPMQTMMMDRRSPTTSTVHVQDRRSPVAFLDDIEEGRRSPSHHFATASSGTGTDLAGMGFIEWSSWSLWYTLSPNCPRQ